MRSAECGVCFWFSGLRGKCGVWKLRQFSISIFHSHAEKQCGTTGMLTNKKKRDASLHFLDAQFVLYTNAPVYTNVLTPDTIT